MLDFVMLRVGSANEDRFRIACRYGVRKFQWSGEVRSRESENVLSGIASFQLYGSND